MDRVLHLLKFINVQKQFVPKVLGPLCEVPINVVHEVHVDKPHSDNISGYLADQVVLVEQVLQDHLALLAEFIVLIVLCSVEYDHSQDHDHYSLHEAVELDDGGRHLSCGDLLLEVD